MADMKRYRRCRNCGAVLDPEDSFCPQCGVGTERSYEGREPVRSEIEYNHPVSGPKRIGSKSNGPKNNVPGSNVQNRYRQENLESNWSEDWGRPVDENRITAMQCVLIVLLVILLAALLALGGFWLFGRSANKSAGQRGSRQDAVLQTEQESTTGDIVTILDPKTGKPAAGEKQEETPSAQTDAPGEQSGTETRQEETAQQSDAGTQSENAGQQSEISPQPDVQSSQTAASWSQPESSTRLLTESDLEGLTYDELQMVINEIYARHGRIFKTPEIGSYFESQPWYEGTLDADHFDESVFSAVEAQNIQIVLGKMGDG